jgi:paraquat-inducible protein A
MLRPDHTETVPYPRAVPQTVACPSCDLLQRIPLLSAGAKARCPRCGQILTMAHTDPLERALALTLAAAVALIVANTMPLMGLEAVGRTASTTIIGGAYEMWLQGREITAAAVAFCAVLSPAAYILFMLAILLAVRRPPAPHWVGELLRWAEFMRPWSMNEVMMLGILVALTKIAQLAKVVPGIGMYAVGVLVVLLAAIMVTFDPREIWEHVEWADEQARLRHIGTTERPR